MIKNSRINVKNSSGIYDALHPETNENVVLVEGGILKDKLASINDSLNSIKSDNYEISINVKNFGAKGDNITNDDLAVQKADLESGVLFFPKGRYILTNPPNSKVYGSGAVLVTDNGYEMKLCDVAQNVNSKWQGYIRMNNTTLGLDCGNNLTSESYGNTAIGHNALKSNELTVRNTAVGNNSQMSVIEGYGNTTVGVDSLHLSKYSDRNTMIGATSGKNIGNDNPNLTNGLFNGIVDTTIDYDNYWSNWRSYAGVVGGCLYVPKSSTETTSNVGVGRNTLGFAQTPTRNVAIGYNALEGGINADNCVAIGECALQFGIKSINSTVVGARAGYHLMDTNQDVVIGRGAMSDTVHSDKNIAIGYQSMLGTSSPNNSVPTSNLAIGRLAMANYNGSINYNVALGEQSLLTNQGNNNVGVGFGALAKTTTGSNNTAIGHNAGNKTGTQTFNNTTTLGANAFCNGDNQVQLGDSSTTTYVYGAVQTRSDKRDKSDIRECSLGLDFINKLKPVDYKWDFREDYYEDVVTYSENGEELIERIQKEKTGEKKRSRYHHGLIAQDVEEIIKETGIDFGGFQNQNINDGNDVLSIGYEELIAPLIKSVQELTSKVCELETQLQK